MKFAGVLAKLDALEKVPPPPVLGLDGGFVNADRYPVTKHGRPDWCSRCSSLEGLRTKNDPFTAIPSRQLHELVPAEDRTAPPSRVAIGLCADCLRLRLSDGQRVKRP